MDVILGIRHGTINWDNIVAAGIPIHDGMAL